MKVKVIASLLVLTVSVVVGRPASLSSSFRCPSTDSISPCTCRELHALSFVRCTGLKDIETMQNALRHKFNCHIPWLKITDNQLSELPAGAFANISITRLLINGSKIGSASEDTFEGQEALEFLALEKDDFRSTPRAALSKLQRLKTLSLSGNALTSITIGDFSNHPILAHLILFSNKIDRIEKGSFPTSLQGLSLSDNRLTTLNDTVLPLFHIKWLFAANNRLVSVEGQLDGLYHLQLLNLAGNSLSELGDSFKDLTDLSVLNLAFNQIRKLGNAFQNLGQLEKLNISGNRLVGELVGDELFANLTRLQLLDLSSNGLTSLGDALKPLNSLLSLNLSQNSLIALSHDEMQWLRSLRDLDVSHNQLVILDDTFGQDLSKMVSLILADNHLESLHGCLKHLNELQELDLSFNNLTSLESYDIPSTGRLHHVRLSGNPWVCDGMLTHTLHDLDTRLIHVDGRPTCSLAPDGF